MFTEDGLNDYREKDCIEKEELIEIFNEFACDTLAIEVVQENFLIAGILVLILLLAHIKIRISLLYINDKFILSAFK